MLFYAHKKSMIYSFQKKTWATSRVSSWGFRVAVCPSLDILSKLQSYRKRGMKLQVLFVISIDVIPATTLDEDIPVVLAKDGKAYWG